MKKNLTLVFILATMTFAVHAQRCTSGAAPVYSYLSSLGSGGFLGFGTDPYFCVDSGGAVSDTIYFMCFRHVNSDSLVYLKIDSINNLPQGLCWRTSFLNDTMRAGYVGYIYIRGTCTAPTGVYKLRFSVSVYNNSLSGYSYNQADPDTIHFDSEMRLFIGVKKTTAVCPAFIDSFYPPVASVTPTGPVTICSYNTTTLTASSGAGYTYHWSTGATTQSITVHTQGTYKVTVHSAGGVSAVSNSVVVNVDTLQAHFTLMPDTTPHHWLAIDQSTPAHSFASRRWDWGDSTSSSSFISLYNHYAHTYAAPGYYNVCLTVTRPLYGCHSTYCDSSTYITKTDASMAVLTLVDEDELTTGVNSIYASPVHIYPNPVSASLTIEAPAAMPDGAVIYDALGKVVREVDLPGPKTIIDVRALPAGGYTLSFRDRSVHSVRFTISR